MEDGHRSSRQNLPFERGSHWMTKEVKKFQTEQSKTRETATLGKTIEQDCELGWRVGREEDREGRFS